MMGRMEKMKAKRTQNPTISLKPDTKTELDGLKLVEEESYDSIIKRLIQKWKKEA